MGKYSYDTYAQVQAQTSTSTATVKKEFPKIGHFWLSEKKPTAIVRFDVESGKDLEIVDVHNVKVTRDNKTFYRDVACLRNSDEEPWKNCPLCAHDIKTRTTKVYVRLLEYVIIDGKVVAQPMVWSRYHTFANELNSMISDYGDLRECLFKVTWTKEPSAKKATYTVRLQPEKGIYTEEAGYVKDFSAFKGLLINKHSYMERTFDELETFVKTGELASRVSTATATTTVKADAEDNTSAGMPPAFDTLSDDSPYEVETSTPEVTATSVDDNPTTARRRRYDFTDDDKPF